jgi:hypothetical protein
MHRSADQTHGASHESLQRATVNKESCAHNGTDHAVHLLFISSVPPVMYVVYTHHLALVRPPNNGFVVNGIFCGSGPWDDLAIGDVERVQDTDYGELASAGALLFCQKLSMDM